MGERAFVNKSIKARTKNTNRLLKLPFDVPLLLVVMILLVFGLLMVYSASWDASLRINKPPTYIFWRQVLWIILGLIGAFILSLIDYHRYEKFLIVIMAGIILALIAVLLINDMRFNSSRALLGGSIQPAEFAKVVIIIYLSFWLYKRKDDLVKLSNGLIPLSMIFGFIGGLVILQPDISAAATIVILGIMLFFLAGGDWKQILLLTAVGLVVGSLVVIASSTGRSRLSGYFASLQDPAMGSYHIKRVFEAIIKGGVFGVGIGKADTKFTGLPLPHTDSIFAVVAEETGIIGGIFVLLLFGVLLWRGLVIARRAPDQLGSLLAFGFTGWILFEALMNIAVIVGLFPITGNALPFISAGGSSMIANLAAIGIIMNVARNSVKKETSERNHANAVVDMRRRNGGRSVSRSDRFTSPQN
ncbi:MAG: FtsW/RodA/SpoVE family cell cycle protein [Anaerolineaceae bacterium]|nr:FtsW/RodA/SpoVE family cell cycle protein [Anaerolineaceae bacterium]